MTVAFFLLGVVSCWGSLMAQLSSCVGVAVRERACCSARLPFPPPAPPGPYDPTALLVVSNCMQHQGQQPRLPGSERTNLSACIKSDESRHAQGAHGHGVPHSLLLGVAAVCWLQEVTVETEVRAAHNVLEACAQTESMERVVFTSSVTAVVWNDDGGGSSRHKAPLVDEKSWSDLALCRKFKLWHALAKTLSEKTAWALAMDRDVDMVAINAGLLTGPGLTAAHPYLKGAPDMYDHGVLVTVDVDFLADAHVAAYESPTAYGRYLCFNNAVCRPEDALKLAQMLSPSAPRSPPSDELKVVPQRIQNMKLSKLMLEYASGIYGELD